MALQNIYTIIKDDGTTIALSAETAAAPFVGYHLQSVTPRVGNLEVARNGSPYTDGTRIVNQRSDNVIEQYTLDIVGSSPDDAMLKLADLYQIVYWARDCQINPGVLTPPGITVAYPGMTRSGFAYIIGGSVSETSQTPRLQVEGNRIKNIVLTLERTRWYKSSGSNSPGTDNPFVASAQYNFGAVPFDGIARVAINGDVPAKTNVEFAWGGSVGSQASIGRIVCGYMSDQRMRGGYTGITIPTTPFLYEAESFATKTNFANVASGGASGGVYVASTTTSGSILSASINLPVAQKYRVFARLQNTAGSDWKARLLVVSAALSVMPFSPYITPAASEWRMYDMGVINLPTGNGFNASSANPTEPIQLFLSGFGTTGQMYVDCFILIPCGEYYLDMRVAPGFDLTAAGQAVKYSNIAMPQAVGAYTGTTPTNLYSAMQWSGDMRFPPGKGAFFWLLGNTNFANTIGQTCSLTIKYSQQYETPPTS